MSTNSQPVPSWTSLAPVIQAYLPEKHQKLFDLTKENLTTGPWTSTMDVYGDKEMFMKDIKEFMNIPGGSTYFELNLADPYFTTPIVYTSLKRYKYIYKQDLLVKLQEIVAQADLPFKSPNGVEFIGAIIGFFLKTKEYELRNNLELVPYPEDALDEFEKKLNDETKNVQTVLDCSSETSIHEVFQRLQLILPMHESDPQYKTVLARLEAFNEEAPEIEKQHLFQNILNFLGMIIKNLEGFIKKHPELFSPDHFKGDKPLVRIFEDGPKQFVWGPELIREMKKVRLDASPVENQMDGMETFAFPELFKIIRSDIGKIEFIKTPIRRTTRRSVFLPSTGGKYFILKSDFLLELLREQITVDGLFRGQIPPNWENLQNCYHALEVKMRWHTNKSKLMDVEEARVLRLDAINTLKSPRQLHKVLPIDVMKIGNGGTTENELKKECKRLGLAKTLPLFDRHFNNFLDEAKLKKNLRELRTRDLHNILEESQLCCAMMRLPQVYRLLHLLDACRHVKQICYFCCGNEIVPTPRDLVPDHLHFDLTNIQRTEGEVERLAEMMFGKE